MNHLVPEQMFSKEEHQAQGISAVKALALASQQGQKIWTINRSNINLALSRINLGADAENDIRNAVNAGKIATAHEARINFNGWVGEGYTLIDPQTGAGGYIISGGGNGGVLDVDPSKIIGAAFDLVGLIFGVQELNSVNDEVKIFRALGKVFQAFGLFFDVVFNAFDVIINCPNLSPVQLGIILGMVIGFAIAMTYFSFFTGGLGMFLLNSTFNSFLKIIMDQAFRIVKEDAGCQ